METHKKGKQGFASMSPDKRREIASKGGKSAQAQGRAHKWNSEEAKEMGRLGGKATAEIKKREIKN